MDRTRWLALLVFAGCIAFAVSFSVGKSTNARKPARSVAAQREGKKPEDDDLHTLVASLEDYRAALAEKDREVEELRAQIDELRAQLALSVTPEDYDEYREWVTDREQRERSKESEQRIRELTRKIFQRKDRVLREQALDELAALLQSSNPEDILLGLDTLPSLREINLDPQRFKPQVLAALEHRDPLVRNHALGRLWSILPKEEILEWAIVLSKDPSADVRSNAAVRLAEFVSSDRGDGVVPILRELVREGDKSTKYGILMMSWNSRDVFPDVEDVLIELARDDPTGNPLGWFGYEGPLSEKVVRAFVELYDEGRAGRTSVRWTQYQLSEDAKPVAIDFCLHLLSDGIEPAHRREALRGLEKIGDPSVIPELQQIVNSPDAEGIEDELAETIEHLQNAGRQ